jgi:hypothetical protein
VKQLRIDGRSSLSRELIIDGQMTATVEESGSRVSLLPKTAEEVNDGVFVDCMVKDRKKRGAREKRRELMILLYLHRYILIHCQAQFLLTSYLPEPSAPSLTSLSLSLSLTMRSPLSTIETRCCCN